MRHASRQTVRIALLVLLGLGLGTGAVAAGDSADGSPNRLLVLGPLPAAMGEAGAGPLAPQLQPVPELDPVTADPHAGDEVVLDPRGAVSWREVTPAGSGVVSLPREGVYWLAVRATVGRWTRLTVTLTGGAGGALWVDGHRVAGPGEEGGPVHGETEAARGGHLVLARVERRPGAESAKVTLTAAADPAAGIAWSTGGPLAPTRFDEMREIVRIGPLAVGNEGRYIARRLTRRDPAGEGRRSTVDVLDAEGNVVAASVGAPSAVPVAFSPKGDEDVLLLKQKGRRGADLVLYDIDARSLRTVVRDEPELGFVKWGPGGTHLLLASTRGVAKPKRDDKAAHRRAALREKLPDWQPRRYLELVEVATGARRRLTVPGDWVLDDAAFVAPKRSVVYARTVPLADHPWFATEIRWIDLIKGTDTLVATFTAGWESRPSSLSPSLDGRTVAFLGPPEEVEQGHAEHNVYNRAVWLLDVESGKFEKLSSERGPAFTLGRGELLSWAHRGHSLVCGISDGSITRLARLAKGTSGWRSERLGTIAEAISQVVLSPDRLVAAYVGAGRALPLQLHRYEIKDERETVIERPNAGLAGRWMLSAPDSAAFKGPGGQRIDAWYYPATVKAGEGKIPLIVYYYGGATPTRRRFNTTHQVLAANGYTVLVINPRGALGYGQAFADVHAGDWGPEAAADIVAGVDAFLAAHDEVDGERVGIYGGSYGGFMTEYLVSTTDRFRAAVALYGISDIASYWGAGEWGYTYGDMAAAGAAPWNAAKLYEGHSPVYRADKIHTPLLLLHGEADANVPEEESEQLYTALRALDREVELVTFPGEGHGIAGSFTNWVTSRTMLLDFFDRWLRDQPEAWNERWKKERGVKSKE